MPLLSVLRRDPLLLQFRHLSLLEFHCAKALCRAAKLHGVPRAARAPWRWGAAWANVVRLGVGCGDGFGRGLAHAAGLLPCASEQEVAALYGGPHSGRGALQGARGLGMQASFGAGQRQPPTRQLDLSLERLAEGASGAAVAAVAEMARGSELATLLLSKDFGLPIEQLKGGAASGNGPHPA